MCGESIESRVEQSIGRSSKHDTLSPLLVLPTVHIPRKLTSADVTIDLPGPGTCPLLVAVVRDTIDWD